MDVQVGGRWKSPRELGTTVADPVFGPLSSLPWTKDKFALMPALFLGSVVFSNQPVVVQKLTSLQLLHEGVLGCDFLLRNYAILNCGKRRLYVRERPPNAEIQAVVRKTLELSHFRPVKLKVGHVLGVACEADLNGSPITLLVDTGADTTVVDRATAQRCNVAWSKKGEVWKIQGFKGRNSRIYALDPVSFYLGSWPISAAALKTGDLSGWNLGAKGNPPAAIDGLLGLNELAREGALLDLAAGTMWLKPDRVSVLRSITEQAGD